MYLKTTLQHMVLLLLVLFSAPGGTNTLTVMTSYPQPVVAVIQEAFETAHPDIQLNILWRRPNDALSVLLDGSTAADVLWMPSLRTFVTLKAADKLQVIDRDKIEPAQHALPVNLGDTPISDPEGYYLAYELAGYGLFYQADKLAEANLPIPRRWQDLMQAEWANQVALPIPSQVGFAPMLIDQLLQSQGWQAGWNQWQQIAANSQLIGSGGQFVTDLVLNNQVAVALTLDFFAATALLNEGRGQFVYPEQTAFNPAHIALLAAAAQPEAAKHFIDYVLSDAGQAMLLHPDVRKLPVRPSVYTQAPELQNPFENPAAHHYDHQIGLDRRALNAIVFDAAITQPHALLKQAWHTWHALSATASTTQQTRLADIRTQLLAWPVAEPAADDPMLQACNNADQNAADAQRCDAFKSQLTETFKQHYQQVLDQLTLLQKTS